MLSFAIFYLAIAAILAIVVAIGATLAPKGERAELATWGVALAALWFFFLVALVADEIISRVTRLARRLKAR